jgi:hypothetical protein
MCFSRCGRHAIEVPGSVEMPGLSAFSLGSNCGSAPAFWPGVSVGHSGPSPSSGSEVAGFLAPGVGFRNRRRRAER